MNFLDKDLMNEADLRAAVAKYKFYKEVCKGCIGTKLHKKRDCDLLHGYRKPCCKLMDDFVEKQNKEINKKIIKKALGDLLHGQV